MSIVYKIGDMFDETADAIVNTVNCVGVMGKGVALEFKKRWPDNFQAYKKLCANNKLQPGHMFIFENTINLNANEPRYLINFPTKAHWRAKSKLEYIENGLNDFISEIQKRSIKSVIMPPLGCGNGGLGWSVVKPLMEKKLALLPEVMFIIFIPKEETAVPEYNSVSFTLTEPRAVLIKMLGDFEDFFAGSFTRLSVQKLVYFLQVLEIDFGLTFRKEEFGPYSAALHGALKKMNENQIINGYNEEHPEITVHSNAYAKADEYLQKNTTYLEKLDTLSKLIEGYESPYGLELLASVDYLYRCENIKKYDDLYHSFSSWNENKRKTFPKNHISAAAQRLITDNLIHISK